jgi:hypothetical protein
VAPPVAGLRNGPPSLLRTQDALLSASITAALRILSRGAISMDTLAGRPRLEVQRDKFIHSSLVSKVSLVTLVYLVYLVSVFSVFSAWNNPLVKYSQ